MICAIYARKSNEQNGVADEAKSVTRQIEHARAYAAKKGWIVLPFALGCALKPDFPQLIYSRMCYFQKSGFLSDAIRRR